VRVISRQAATTSNELRQEIKSLRDISHPNIVRFVDLKKSPSHFYYVLEFCAGGDLSHFLQKHGRIQEEIARKLLTQIAAGICTLHHKNVMHWNLKPRNVLLSNNSDNPVLKIADYHALQLGMPAAVWESPLYVAPEVLRLEPYNAKADLWSVGAVFYEMLLGRPPFSGAKPLEILANIDGSEGLSFNDAQVSSDGQDFLKVLLMRSPAQRLSSKEFAWHAYVRLYTLPDADEYMLGSAEESTYRPAVQHLKESLHSEEKCSLVAAVAYATSVGVRHSDSDFSGARLMLAMRGGSFEQIERIARTAEVAGVQPSMATAAKERAAFLHEIQHSIPMPSQCISMALQTGYSAGHHRLAHLLGTALAAHGSVEAFPQLLSLIGMKHPRVFPEQPAKLGEHFGERGGVTYFRPSGWLRYAVHIQEIMASCLSWNPEPKPGANSSPWLAASWRARFAVVTFHGGRALCTFENTLASRRRGELRMTEHSLVTMRLRHGLYN